MKKYVKTQEKTQNSRKKLKTKTQFFGMFRILRCENGVQKKACLRGMLLCAGSLYLQQRRYLAPQRPVTLSRHRLLSTEEILVYQWKCLYTRLNCENMESSINRSWKRPPWLTRKVWLTNRKRWSPPCCENRWPSKATNWSGVIRESKYAVGPRPCFGAEEVATSTPFMA